MKPHPRRLRAHLLAVLVAVASGAPSAGCSLALDFDDQCTRDADCDAVGRGLRCDRGFCVKRDLVQVDGPCGRLFGEDPRDAEPGSVILLGTILPKSGALGTQGQPMENGVDLAVNQINQIGGVLGRKIGVLACDSGTSSAQAVAAARHLIDVGGVDAIIGAGASGTTIDAFSTVAKQAGVLMISPSATSPAISNLSDDGLLWRTAPSDAIQGRAIAGYLLERGLGAGQHHVAIVNRDDAYGNGLALVVQQEFCAAAAACTDSTFLVDVYGSDADAAGLAAEQQQIVDDLVAFGPDAVVLIAYPQDGLQFLSLASGKGFAFVLTDGTKDLGLLGAHLATPQEGLPTIDDATLCALVGTNPSAPAPEYFDAFARAYQARFDTSPNNFEAKAFDALYAVGLAYAAATGAGVAPGDIDGRALAQGLTRLSAGDQVRFGIEDWNTGVTALSSGDRTTVDVSGASGPLDFNAVVGEAPGAIDLWRLDLDAPQDDGKIEELGVVLDDTGDYIQGVVGARDPNDACRTTR